MDDLAALITVARWLKASADQSVSPDEVVDALPLVDLVRNATDDDSDGNRESVALLAARMAQQRSLVRLVVATPGQPGPWAPSREILMQAIAAGGAIIIDSPSLILIPAPREPGQRGADPAGWGQETRWRFVAHAVAADVHAVTDISTSRRQLMRLLRESTETLTQLDIASGRDRVEATLHLHTAGVVLDPPGERPEASELVALALRVLAIIDAARRDPGGAVGGSAQRLRLDALAPLADAAREALMACINDEVQPHDQ